MQYGLVFLAVLLISACEWLPTTRPVQDDLSDFAGEPFTLAFAPTSLHFAETATVVGIVAADLERSGRFQTTLVSAPTSAEPTIDFTYWNARKISHVLTGSALSGTNRIKLNFTLWDVKRQSQQRIVDTTVYATELRAQAHALSDRIFSRLIRVSGSFSAQLVYVTANTETKPRRYQLWIADADGQNKKAVFSSSQPVMSPTWSPDGTKIGFASFQEGGRQQVYILDRKRDTVRPITLDKPGLSGAPAWSPDGNQLAFTLIQNGNADIYTLELRTQQIKRLTCEPSIDTESAWSPDGRSIIFTSDRHGLPQLYEVSANGGPAQRLTYHGRENAQATVSPNGKHIAMLHSHNGKYRIALLERKTGEIRVLSDGELDESPSFSANGSMLIYTSAVGNKTALFAMSVDGRSKQQLAVDDDMRDPAWSPVF